MKLNGDLNERRNAEENNLLFENEYGDNPLAQNEVEEVEKARHSSRCEIRHPYI